MSVNRFVNFADILNDPQNLDTLKANIKAYLDASTPEAKAGKGGRLLNEIQYDPKSIPNLDGILHAFEQTVKADTNKSTEGIHIEDTCKLYEQIIELAKIVLFDKNRDKNLVLKDDIRRALAKSGMPWEILETKDFKSAFLNSYITNIIGSIMEINSAAASALRDKLLETGDSLAPVIAQKARNQAINELEIKSPFVATAAWQKSYKPEPLQQSTAAHETTATIMAHLPHNTATPIAEPVKPQRKRAEAAARPPLPQNLPTAAPESSATEGKKPDSPSFKR